MNVSVVQLCIRLGWTFVFHNSDDFVDAQKDKGECKTAASVATNTAADALMSVEDARILSAESIVEVSPSVSSRMWVHFTLTDVETQSWTAITAWQTFSRSRKTTFKHIKCQTRATQMGTSQWFLLKRYKPVFSGWLHWWTTRTLIVCSGF